MTLTAQEESALLSAFREIETERKNALRCMFEGTQLSPKSRISDAKTLLKEAKSCKEKITKIPGVALPSLTMPTINVNIFRGINLLDISKLSIPSLSLPFINLDLIPDIPLINIPGFSLANLRINLKGILINKDLFPNISLRALVYALAVKWPDINFPSLLWDFSNILNINFDVLFPTIKINYPDFFNINLDISLPSIAIPDVNFPTLPTLELPNINFGNIDLGSINIPGIDLPEMIKIPGFEKVLKLLLELFDALDLNIIIEELSAEFIVEFFSSALPIVQQVKAGAQAAHKWGKAAQDWHKANKTEQHKPFLLPGDARSACDAVKTLLIQSRDQHAALAGIETTQLAVSTAGLFADLGGITGPAVAAAAAVAKTCQKIIIMGARYKEMKNVNLVLSNSPAELLSAHIFTISPLLACYYLTNNTTSNVLNILSKNIIQDNWMSEWERNKLMHLDPLIKESQRFIQESRYVLTPIRQDKGMFTPLGRMEKLQASFKLYIQKKLGRAPANTVIATHKNIGKR
jgi:hypothetical protein